MRVLHHVGAVRRWSEVVSKCGLLSHQQRPSGSIACEFVAVDTGERWYLAGDPLEWATFYEQLGRVLRKEGVDVSTGAV